jgi:hypothetical protein
LARFAREVFVRTAQLLLLGALSFANAGSATEIKPPVLTDGH